MSTFSPLAGSIADRLVHLVSILSLMVAYLPGVPRILSGSCLLLAGVGTAMNVVELFRWKAGKPCRVPKDPPQVDTAAERDRYPSSEEALSKVAQYAEALMNHKAEAMDAMKRYHDSEIRHQQNALEMMRGLFVGFIALFAATFGIILKGDSIGLSPLVASLILLVLSYVVELLCCSVLFSTIEKINNDNLKYSLYKADYVYCCRLLFSDLLDKADFRFLFFEPKSGQTREFVALTVQRSLGTPPASDERITGVSIDPSESFGYTYTKGVLGAFAQTIILSGHSLAWIGIFSSYYSTTTS